MNGAKIAKTIAWAIVVVVLLVILIGGIAGADFFGWNNRYGCNGIIVGSNWYGTGRLPEGAAAGQNAEQSLDGVKGIAMDFFEENIEVVLTDENKIRVEQKSDAVLSDEEIMRYGMINGEFVAQSGHFGKNITGIISYASSTVTLYIPQKLDLPLSLSTTSGTINIAGGAYQALSTDTMSGEILGKGITAKTIDADSVSGSIRLEEVACNGLSVDTTSGEIVLSGDAGYFVNTDSTSGSIRFEGNADRADVSSVSGEVSLTLAAPKSVDAETTSGKISLVCADAAQLKEINADSMSGSVSITLPENDGFTLSFDSLSGSVKNQFEMIDEVHKNGKIDIDVETTSGSLDIVRKS